MSGSSAKPIPEINLEAYERRLRSGDDLGDGGADPLAELTRLVNMISGENAKAEPAAPPARTRLPRAAGLPLAANDGREARLAAPTIPVPPAVKPPFQDAPAESDAFPPPPAPSFDYAVEDTAPAVAVAAPAAIEPRSGRSSSWRVKTVGLAAVGVLLLGGALAMKSGVVPGMRKAPPFIAAAAGPNKIQPPSDATVQSSGDATALLMKDSATSAPVKIVSKQEQPVDLTAQTPSPDPAASAAPTPTPTPAVSASPPAVASPSPSATPAAVLTASPVAPASDTPIVAPADSSATVAPLFPEAKPVKTVSVRPDGTLISADAAPTPAAAPPAKPAADGGDGLRGATAVADAEPATPTVDLPTKLSPKSSARIVAKTDTTAPASATATTPNGPLQLDSLASGGKPKTRSVKPAVVADAAATDAPDASEPAAAVKGAGAAAGGWSVQFAAPRTEEDAQRAITRLKSKYATELGGADLGVRKADVKGHTIYRVRAEAGSKADAAALCAKLKESGGDCFIVRD